MPTKRAKKAVHSVAEPTMEEMPPAAPNDQEMVPPAPNDQEMAAAATDAVCSPTRLIIDQIIQNSPIRVTRGYATH